MIVTHELSKLIGSLNEDTVLNKINCFELFANGRMAKVSLPKPDLVIERTKLLNELADRARVNGAKIHSDQRFLDFKPNGTRLKFRVTNNGFANAKEASTHILIGADGAFSNVAKFGGWPRQKTAPLIQAVVKLPSDMPSDTSRVWFLPEDTPYFYWLIPHSSSEGVLGLIAEDMQRGRHSLEQFMRRKGLKPSFVPKCTDAYLPSLGTYSPPNREGRCLPSRRRCWSCEIINCWGCRYRIRGALSVVDHILGKNDQENLTKLRSELKLHWIIRKSLNSFTQNDYVELFDHLKPSILKILSTYTRDESIKLIFHLCLRQPKLLSIGLGKLLRNYTA